MWSPTGACCCRENLMNPDMLRRAMEPANISAMMQMQQAMQQLQSSGMMPPGAMPGLNYGPYPSGMRCTCER